MLQNPQIPFDVLVIALTGICLYTDLRCQKIYNKVLFPFALAGIALQLYFHGPKGLLEGAAGFLTGLLLLLIPFARHQMGAGDVKLLAVIGIYKGPQFTLLVFLGAALAGGAAAAVLLGRRGRLLSAMRAIGYNFLFRLFRLPIPYTFTPLEEAAPGDYLPFGAALAAGVLAAYLFADVLG
ncbi:MAG: A24 family peptidase [Bacillota bacterium]